MRNGLGCALVIAMGAPLAHALAKTFQTMLNLQLESVDPGAVPGLEGTHLVGAIGFSGRASGVVRLRLSQDSAREIAAHILGVEPAAVTDAAEIADAVGELTNIMTGNFKSNLSDAGLNCRLRPPVVGETSGAVISDNPRASQEQMAFRATRILLFVSLSVDPWSGEGA